MHAFHRIDFRVSRSLWIETVAYSYSFRCHDRCFDCNLRLIDVVLCLLYASLEVVNLNLGSFTRVSTPDLTSFRLVRYAMDRFLLLVVVGNASGDLLLYQSRVCSQESQLAGVEDLLLLLYLCLELLETLSVEGDESQILP